MSSRFIYFLNSLWCVCGSDTRLRIELLFNFRPVRRIWNHLCQFIFIHPHDPCANRWSGGFHVCLRLDTARPGYRQFDRAADRRYYVRYIVNVSDHNPFAPIKSPALITSIHFRSWDIAFYAAGVFIFISGILAYFTAILEDREEQATKEKDAEQLSIRTAEKQ